MTTDERQRLEVFLRSLSSLCWFSHAGEPFFEGVVVASITEGWDDWNDKMMAVWRVNSEKLERTAISIIGDQGIDDVFAEVAEITGPVIDTALRAYFGRCPVHSDTDLDISPDLLDTMKRDVAWAAVEAVIDRLGFFTGLMPYYRSGRWPCSWDGCYPAGRIVVL